jgi:hypothetical protein
MSSKRARPNVDRSLSLPSQAAVKRQPSRWTSGPSETCFSLCTCILMPPTRDPLCAASGSRGIACSDPATCKRRLQSGSRRAGVGVLAPGAKRPACQRDPYRRNSAAPEGSRASAHDLSALRPDESFGDIPVVPIRRGRRCGALSDSPRCRRAVGAGAVVVSAGASPSARLRFRANRRMLLACAPAQ